MGSRASLILTSPEGDVEYALNFEFSASNNKAEHEALVTSLKIPKEVGVQYFTIFSNSQLIVGQIKGKYEAWKEYMKKYLGKVKYFTLLF